MYRNNKKRKQIKLNDLKDDLFHQTLLNQMEVGSNLEQYSINSLLFRLFFLWLRIATTRHEPRGVSPSPRARAWLTAGTFPRATRPAPVRDVHCRTDPSHTPSLRSWTRRLQIGGLGSSKLASGVTVTSLYTSSHMAPRQPEAPRHHQWTWRIKYVEIQKVEIDIVEILLKYCWNKCWNMLCQRRWNTR